MPSPATPVDFFRRGRRRRQARVFGGARPLMGLLPSIASARTPKSDVAILNFALTLEYLESEFYAEAVANGKLTDPKNTVRFAAVVAQHEDSHVKFLRACSERRRSQDRSSTSRAQPPTKRSSRLPPTCSRTPACTPTSVKAGKIDPGDPARRRDHRDGRGPPRGRHRDDHQQVDRPTVRSTSPRARARSSRRSRAPASSPADPRFTSASRPPRGSRLCIQRHSMT